MAVQKNSRVQKRCSPAGQESEESSSCASSRSSSWRSWRSGIPEEGPRGWWGGLASSLGKWWEYWGLSLYRGQLNLTK